MSANPTPWRIEGDTIRDRDGGVVVSAIEILLCECPFCGATVHMDAGLPFDGCGGTPSYTFVHPGNECVVRRAIVFVNRREAMEWAAMWNRRVAQ